MDLTNDYQDPIDVDTDSGECLKKKNCKRLQNESELVRPPSKKARYLSTVSRVHEEYRRLSENQYTADIKKGDIRKNYEPSTDKCNCARAVKEMSACGFDCINRSTFVECDIKVCVNGAKCSNMVIQTGGVAPGLERFMTAEKGLGIRATKSIARGSFIFEYTGEVCSSQEFQKRMITRYKEDIHHYCLAIDNKIVIDAHRAGSE